MHKKLLLLISLILLVALGGVAMAEPINIRNHSYEYAYVACDDDPPVDPCQDPNYWILIEGHTGMESVAAWTNVGNWLGVDVYCPFAACGDLDHCWDIGGCPDGQNVCYSQHGKDPPIYMYQVLDHEVTNGMMYTLKFDAMAWDELYYDVALFWDAGDDTGHDLPENEFYIESFYAGPIAPGVDPVDWDIYYTPDGGVTVWGYGPDAFDKTLIYVVDDNPSYAGMKLGIKIYCAGEDGWGFIDNIRLDGELATKAYDPVPGNDESNVGLETTQVSWSAGMWADQRDIYFGTDFEAVQNRDPSVYKDHLVGDTTWALDTTLEIAGVYYWAVDEDADDYTGAPYDGPWVGGVWTFYANDGTACKPFPSNRDDMVPVDVVLNWAPGIGATQTDPVAHRVYFGTSFDDVNDADMNSTGIYRGSYGYDVNTYAPQVSPTEQLILGQDYYWRVDELNPDHPSKIWKGHIWTFRAQDYHLLDDIEGYGGTATLTKVWIDGYDYVTFSVATLNTNTTRGKRSMEYQYQNQLYPYYSRVYARPYPGSGTPGDYLPFGPDWTANGAKSLALWFYGQDDNAAAETERMYVVLEDTAGKSAEVPYKGDIADIRKELWQEWNIALDDFLEVEPLLNLASIARIHINFGDRNAPTEGGDGFVYFDDVRLYPSRCVPKLAYASGSFDGDCVTDYFDLAMMADDWLLSGRDVVPEAPSDPPLIHYEMEDGSGTTVANTGNGGATYNGTFGPDPCDPYFTTGYVGDGLRFDNDSDGEEGDFVTCNNPLDIVTDTLSITAWVKRDLDQVIYAPVVFWRSEGATVGLGLGGTGDPDWEVNNELCYHWADAENSWSWHNGLILPAETWTFIALTVAPDVASLYMSDGTTIQAVSNYAEHPVQEFNDVMYLSMDSEGEDRHFAGVIDDVRVYTLTLSAAEVMGIAGLSGSHYIPLESWRTDSDKDDDVDMKDYAVMADYWLEETLFPIP